jgi:hypothetical protein
MNDFNAFVSREYPALHSVGRGTLVSGPVPDGHAALSLGLLVEGIPSFLATIPVEERLIDQVTGSLDQGDVRVAVVGVSVDGRDLPRDAEAPIPEPWQPGDEESRTLPAAFLSLVCADGRRIGVARIVARERSASPEEVARFVLDQIAKGVQIPDLASTP